MKNLFAPIVLCVAAALLSASASAQEIPAELKAQIESKAQELHPNDKAAERSWRNRQIEAWESIQNMTFSVDEEELNLIKSAAQKKFPYEYSKQENFINEQANLASGMSEYKAQFGPQVYKAMRESLNAKGITDLNEIVESLRRQLSAKAYLESFSPSGVDPAALKVAAEVVAKLFPSDYEAQLKQLKTQFNISEIQGSQNGAPLLQNGPVANGGGAANPLQNPNENVPLFERQKIIRDTYQRQSFFVEGGAAKCIALAMELNGRRVLLAPFSSYSPNGMTVTNASGEQIEFDIGDITASKELPLIAILPKSMPPDISNITLFDERDFKSILGKRALFVGYANSKNSANVTSFPIRISAVSNSVLTLSTKISTDYSEGALVVQPSNYAMVGMLLMGKDPVKNVEWTDRSGRNKVMRDLDLGRYSRLICARVDNLRSWEKIDSQKFSEQKSKLENLKATNIAISNLLSKNKLSDVTDSPIIGRIAEKYIGEFAVKMDKTRFMLLYRGYNRDMIDVLKRAMKGMAPNEYYTVFRGEIMQQLTVANGLISVYTKAMDGVSNDLTPKEIMGRCKETYKIK